MSESKETGDEIKSANNTLFFVGVGVFAFVSLLFLYAASIGPATMTMESMHLWTTNVQSVYKGFYSPLKSVCDATGTRSYLTAYTAWWRKMGI